MCLRGATWERQTNASGSSHSQHLPRGLISVSFFSGRKYCPYELVAGEVARINGMEKPECQEIFATLRALQLILIHKCQGFF